MEIESESFVPSPEAFAKLAEYADLLARFGASSSEAMTHYNANQNIPQFAGHARDLHRLEQDDQMLRNR